MSGHRVARAPSASAVRTLDRPVQRALSLSRRPLRWFFALPAAAIGGIAGFGAFPELSWWWLAPVSLALLMLAVRGQRPVVAAGLGYLYGWAMLAPLLSWTSIQVGALPWLVLVGLEAGFHALGGLALCYILRIRTPALRWLAAGSSWVAVEALQGRYPFGGFGWTRFAFSQADAPPLALAALGGAPMVTFAVTLAAAALVEAVGSRRPVRAVAWVACGVLVLGAGVLVPRPTTAEQGTIAVAGIQGNVPRMGMEFNAERRAVLDNHARLTQQLADQVRSGAAPPPDLLVWPENASDIDPSTNPDAHRVIDAAVSAIGVPTLVGTLVFNPRSGLIRNIVLLWEPGQGPTASYTKRAPVPFAEYVPYREFFRAITPLVDQAGHFEAGDEVGVLPVPTTQGTVQAGVLICFEVVPDHLVADVIDGGAELLVVPTNNATFGFTDESRQQLAISRLRSVETGRAVVHVSTVGVSALIAPDGTPLAASSLFEPRILQAQLPLRSSLTVASRVRSGPEWVLVSLALIGVVLGARSGGRRPVVPAVDPADPDDPT